MKKPLYEISLMRPIILVFLVLYHSFIIYNSQWTPPLGFEDCSLYKWIARFSYSFLLEAFVFISGYLWYYQTKEQQRNFTIKDVIYNKFKRLLLPSIIFSSLYIILFPNEIPHASPSFFLYLYFIIFGAGHMWFLPMLFWCFVIQWIVDRLNINIWIVLLFAFIASLVSSIPLPCQLNHTLQYYMFFCLGYIFKSTSLKIEQYVNKARILGGVCVFIVSFIGLMLVRDQLINYSVVETELIPKTILSILNRLCMITYSTLGVVMFYSICLKYVANNQLSPHFVQLGGYCFGVYLFQQFILKYLYYYTQLPVLLGSTFLPWFGFIVTLMISLSLCWMLRLTKMGKFIIG